MTGSLESGKNIQAYFHLEFGRSYIYELWNMYITNCNLSSRIRTNWHEEIDLTSTFRELSGPFATSYHIYPQR